MAKQPKSDQPTIKPFLSTKAGAFRQIGYSKLIDLCENSDDAALRYFAVSPAVILWNFMAVQVWTLPDTDLLGLVSKPSGLLAAFEEWLAKPESETEPLTEAVRRANEGTVDPIAAPENMVSDETKNA